MKKVILLLFLSLYGMDDMYAQKKHSNKHVLRPGLSISYLPTWLLDDYDGNTYAQVRIVGINGYQEIWRESVIILGIAHGRIDIKKEKEHTGIIVPFKLQKYFTPDRKGFNLSIGLLMNYCKTCNEYVDGAFTNEISYLFSLHPFEVNVGLQIMEGAIFDDIAVHVGGQIQLTYRPKVFNNQK